MTTTDYRRRASFAEKDETLWRAYPDRLEQLTAEGRLVAALPYTAVKRLRLASAPGRLQGNRYLMEISTSRSRLMITNLHFAGIARFEDRSESFFELVRAVVGGVEASNPDAEFMAGEKPALFGGLLVMNLAAFAMLAGVVLILPIAPDSALTSTILKAGIILISLPLMMSWLLNARPRRFRPHTDLEKVIKARAA